MIRAGLLLAAGASRRFGPDDKLLARLRGRPLLLHAADALRQVPLDRYVAVISNPSLGPLLEGFEVIVIPQGGQSDSLRAGLAHLDHPDRLLIVLGDMPDVTPSLLSQVLAHASDDGPSASHDGQHPMPPACFPRSQLPLLAALSGDRGAARLLRDLPPERLIAAPGQLRDIDRPDQI
ncbi:nucleotidyltransferase family protein [Paracoccus rhizosphaerae]|uniref:NTP transferase domain-containing protein n=1 Tax=Paracoccus rhizosphaerae TaxID=1133347 RepID=A0ABV6CIU4_9RHOB|nr:nucleotidyltransferase family protein [Paracoccus rhizosphaerae]